MPSILGVDPGLGTTGWGIVSAEGNRLAHIAHGIIRTPAQAALPDRLRELHEGLVAVVARYRPEEAAIEEIFVNRNPQSTLKLGQARGVALLSIASMPVAEYATRLIKKAIVGTGAAEKAQIMAMVCRLLPACGPLGEDDADALAVAITHAHLRQGAAMGRRQA